VKNVGVSIDTAFVVVMWNKMTAPGIVEFVRNATIGESGIVIHATNALMELP